MITLQAKHVVCRSKPLNNRLEMLLDILSHCLRAVTTLQPKHVVRRSSLPIWLFSYIDLRSADSGLLLPSHEATAGLSKAVGFPNQRLAAVP